MKDALIESILADQDELWRRAESSVLNRLQQFYVAQPANRLQYDHECRLLRSAVEQLIQAKLSQMAAFEYRVKEALFASPTIVLEDECPTPNGFGG